MVIWSGIAKSLMAPRDSADRMVTTTFFLVGMWSGRTLINEGTGILLSKAGAHFGRFASSMQASYASSHIGYAEKHENHPIRFRMPHAYFLEGNGGAKRRSCRPDRADNGTHE